MSIKIYDGLRAVGRSDIFDTAEEIRTALDAAFFAAMDKALGTLGSNAPKSYAAVHRRIVELDHEPTWTFDPLDIAYTATLLRGRDWPLLLITGEKAGRYTESLVEAGVVERYGYWDNSDPEEGLTEQEWGLRRQDWGRALSRQGLSDFDLSPAEAGLAISSPGLWPIYQHLSRSKKN